MYYYSKQIMKYITKIIGKTKTRNNLPAKLNVDKKDILDKKEIVNEFNNFFCKNWFKAERENTTIKIFF